MKCPICKKANFERRNVESVLRLDRAPDVILEDVSASICTNCGFELIDAEVIEQNQKKFLRKLIDYYADKNSEVPGKVGQWMWRAIGLTAKQLAVEAKISDSTLSKAAENNSDLDRIVAINILLRAHDWLEDTDVGDAFLSKLTDLRDVYGLNKILRLTELQMPNDILSTGKPEKSGLRRRTVSRSKIRGKATLSGRIKGGTEYAL